MLHVHNYSQRIFAMDNYLLLQTVAVDATGISTGTPDRDAARWYQLGSDWH